MPASIVQLQARVCRLLKQHNRKVVFAESCTGGLVSGALTRTPGISAHHCGGVVVYRNETKQAYLGVPADLLNDPGPVSETVARLMATGVLAMTPEADIAAAVTGHLGPRAPAALDGVVYVAIAERGATDQEPAVIVKRFRWKQPAARAARQRLAIAAVLRVLADRLARN